MSKEIKMAEKIVGVAMDFSPCSRKALSWALDNVARPGDHIILVTIQPEGFYEEGEMQLWETTGSPLLPSSDLSDANVLKKYRLKVDAETLAIVNKAVTTKDINIVTKIFWGDPREKLCEAVESIPLSSLVIGNRGLGGLKRVIMGSVSNYVVNNAACPVTVVKL